MICNVTVKHWNNLKRRRKIGCLVVARPQHPVQAQTDAQIRPHNPVLSPARAQIGRSRHPADVPISHLATPATATGGRRARRPAASTETAARAGSKAAARAEAGGRPCVALPPVDVRHRWPVAGAGERPAVAEDGAGAPALQPQSESVQARGSAPLAAVAVQAGVPLALAV